MRLLVAMIATLVVAYFFWWGVANAVEFGLYESLGPFYHYLALGPLAVLAGVGTVAAAAGAGSRCRARDHRARVDRSRHRDRVARRARATATRARPNCALTDAPGRRLVLQDPQFPRDPYVRVANDPDLDGTRVVGIDVPGRRLDAVEQFPGRAAYLVRGFRAAGDPFGPIRREQVQLRVVEGARIGIVSTGKPPAGRDVTSYLRIGDDEQTTPGATATWTLAAADLPTTTVPIVAGYRTGPDEFVECRFEGRRAGADLVRVLTPCDGFVGYAFPDGKTAVSPEDVSDRLVVTIASR